MAVDATTQAQLEGQILNWRVLCWADFDGDVLRATSGIYDKTVSSSGDSELDGTYFSIDHELINVGTVTQQEEGTDTVAISLSGLVVNNAGFLETIGDRTKWQGRTARLWFYCVDANEAQVGSIIPYYTGYMDEISISGSPDSQTVTLTIENYLASIAGAQAKTYLSQDQFDSGDTSAAASIAAANGLVEGVISGSGGGGSGGGGAPGGGGDRPPRETDL